MRLTNNTLESIDKWTAYMNSGNLLQPKPIQAVANCNQCELLKMEVKRLKWLIQNMMTSVEDIEEFNDE